MARQSPGLAAPRRPVGTKRDGAPLTFADVLQLRQAVLRFGAEARDAKLALLAALATRTLDRPRVLREYHDALLCLAAYADDETVALRAYEALASAAEAARALAQARGADVHEASGIAWSEVTAALSHDLAVWLATRFAGDAEITSFGAGGARLGETLALALPILEAEALDDDDDPLALLDRLKGPHTSRLAFLLASLQRIDASTRVRAHLYDALEPYVTLAPHGTSVSRTFLRGTPADFAPQPDPLHRTLDDAAALIRTPVGPPRLLSPDQRLALVDTARATLAMLARETDPITWPSVDAVSLHELPHGWSVALYPMSASRRPPLDTHTGYLLMRNGVPVAYGGGWPFLRVCRTGINVFPAFRGGESAYAFAQVLRVYHAWYGCTRFVVEPYQFGAGNDEGLRSGAFWFYWRLGFRPEDAELATLAAREAARLARRKGGRSPIALMRRLTGSDLVLDVAPMRAGHDVDAGTLAGTTSAWIVREHGGDRDAAIAWAAQRARAALGVSDDRSWPDAERLAFDTLALLVARIDDLARWDAAAKSSCVAVMRAKGADDDRAFFEGLDAHPRLPAALERLATSG
jgi:hypothetical protein